MPHLLEHAGIRQHDKAHHLAHILSVSHRPLTLMFRDTFGIDLHPVPARRGTGRLDDRQAADLDAPAGKPCRWRTGRLDTADGQRAAGVSLLWIPGLLPAQACAELDAAQEAAGAVLDRLPGGMHREYLRAVATDILDEITGETATVRSRAVLVTARGPVAIAEENFLAAFVEALP